MISVPKATLSNVVTLRGILIGTPRDSELDSDGGSKWDSSGIPNWTPMGIPSAIMVGLRWDSEVQLS